MTFAALMLGAPDWLFVAIGLWSAGLMVMGWSYHRAAASPRAWRIALALKLAAIAALAACVVEPLWATTRPRPGENIVLVVADDSASLLAHDAGAPRPRADALREKLAVDAPWLTRLEQDFDVRRYAFAESTREAGDGWKLSFEGTSTALGGSLKTLARRFHGRPVAAVVVLTDALATDDVDALAADSPPIYPVLIGQSRPERDVRIADITQSETPFEDAPVTVDARVWGDGYAGQSIAARLVDEAGHEIAAQSLSLPDASQPAAFRFSIRPDKPGVQFYRLQAKPAGAAWPERATKAADGGMSSESLPMKQQRGAESEATEFNNERIVCVVRPADVKRVLYVTGRPNWECKFIRRALERDEQLQLVALVRIARREPKFDFRGRSGETTNPLFRGFGNQGDEQAEQYDQPVLVRLGARDEDELRDGFPRTAEELFAYDAIVLDDLEASFFSPDQMELVARFVSERGGGLLMLGGQESFLAGGYDRTPIGQPLPVYLSGEGAASAEPVARRLDLAREGWLEPWLRLRSAEPDERRRLAEMPEFFTYNRASGIKPGATVMMHARGAAGEVSPALVVERFGAGRSAALLVGDLWRWQLRQTEAEKDDLGRMWRQTLRWLTAETPGMVSITSEPVPDAPTTTLRLAIEARDAAFEPLDNATARITVTGPDGEPIELSAEPSAERAGVYLATFVPRAAGGYRVMAKVAAPDGSAAGEAATGFASDPLATEFTSLEPNRPLAERLAQRSGGRVIAPDDLDAFVAELPQQRLPRVEPSFDPIWHQPWVWLLVVGCLCGEWGLRRWHGLP